MLTDEIGWGQYAGYLAGHWIITGYILYETTRDSDMKQKLADVLTGAVSLLLFAYVIFMLIDEAGACVI